MSAVQPPGVQALRQNVFEAAIAAAGLISAVAYWLGDRQASSPAITHALGVWQNVWYILYFLGGLFVLSGLLTYGRVIRAGRLCVKGDGRVELAGLVFLCVALLVNAIAIFHYVGYTTTTMLTFATLVIACVVRGYLILTHQRKVVYAPELSNQGRIVE